MAAPQTNGVQPPRMTLMDRINRFNAVGKAFQIAAWTLFGLGAGVSVLYVYAQDNLDERYATRAFVAEKVAPIERSIGELRTLGLSVQINTLTNREVQLSTDIRNTRRDIRQLEEKAAADRTPFERRALDQLHDDLAQLIKRREDTQSEIRALRR